jgi:hypothetical protein
MEKLKDKISTFIDLFSGCGGLSLQMGTVLGELVLTLKTNADF